MFPSEFDYHRAETVDEALDLIASNPEAELLAGGHSLIPMLKTGLADPPALIDIGHIEALSGIETAEDETRIGALTRYAAVVQDENVGANHPAVAEAAGEIGDVQVRNAGTVGGNLAHADPASDLPAAVLAADATLVVRGPDGERTIPADDFFGGMYETDLDETELLTELVFPHGDGRTVGAYVKRASPSSGYAIVGVAAVLGLEGSRITSARIAANGVQDHAFRLSSVEEALTDAPIDPNRLTEVPALARDSVDERGLMDDRQASGEFRTHLVGIYARRALERALEPEGIEVAID
jgi:carbon-monoxide dehydrogenase medium subunit